MFTINLSAARDFGAPKNSETSLSAVLGKTVYNYRTRDEAKAEAQGLYNNIQKGTETIYTSDLVNSYAWDTAIVFIEKCGANSNYAFRIGKSKTDTAAPQTTGTNYLLYDTNGTPKLTSEDRSDVHCNIFDMASNVMEWTTEYSSYTRSSITYPCVFRGGYYDSIGTTSTSCGSITSYSYPNVGFRPLLYL